jgi:hypothetical protein
MKYDEYQVWYHVYTTAIQALCSNIQSADPQHRLSVKEIITNANEIASHASAIFSQIEDKTNIDGINVQGIVEKVLKDATKRK